MTQQGSTWTLGRLVDEHLSLYTLPLAVTITAFVKARAANDWSGLAYGAWVIIGILALLLSGLFSLHNYHLLKFRMRWWHNLLISAGFLGFSVVILIALLRL
ncbi:MAG: hypothetical protein ACLFO2_04515 [Candidatus Woesearchaeota archaeon]